MPTKLEILTNAKAMREQEVLEYQINADNYALAIEQIGEKPDMQDFKAHLGSLLESTRREQAKAQLMLDVINIQLSA